MAKVMIAVPTYGGMVWDETASSIATNAIRATKEGHNVEVTTIRGYGCGPARTRIADRAIAGGFDYVLMVDSDVVLPDGAIVDLLEHETDVCLGFYSHQGIGGEETCLFKPVGHDFTSRFTASELRALRESGSYTFEVKGGGMGCAMISTSVFKRLTYPYFKWVDYSDGHGTLSEDLYFCEECAQSGIAIYADARVACGHFLRRKQEVC